MFKCKFIPLVAFLLVSLQAFSQEEAELKSKIDSIQQIISTTSDDSIKIVALEDWDDLIYLTQPEEDFHINKKIEKICRLNLQKKLKPSRKKYFTISLIIACNHIGSNLTDHGDYQTALKYHMEALRLSLKLKNKKREASSYTGLGNVYGIIGHHQEAIDYYRKSYAIYAKLKDYTMSAVGLNNIGIENSYLGYDDSAIYYYRLSLKYTDLKDYPYDYSTTLNNIGSIFYDANQHDSAMYYFTEAMKIAEELNYEDNQALLSNNIANIYLSRNEYAKAEELFLRAESLAIKSGTILYSLDANSGLATLYQKTHQLDKSIACLERQLLLTDSIYNQEAKQMALEESFQLDMQTVRIEDSISKAKQKEISDLQLKSKNEEIANQKNKQIILFGGLALVFIFAGFMYNRFRITRKQKGIIEEQKLMVEEKQKEILDSITYAKRIQKAILPGDKMMLQWFPNHFVFYRPKDIVAGDFYWMESNEEYVFLAVCDCTGHGVPGAMVSVVCHNALNRSVREFKLTDPGEILNKTRELVIEEFEKSDEDVKDGMDISLIVFEKKSLNQKNKRFQWAGANNPLWILEKDNMKELKADKQPIGKYINPKPFHSHTIDLDEGQMIYLFTDGFADQFGGEKGKKYKYSSLQKLLIQTSREDLEKHGQLLDNDFEKWKGKLEQVDDVCIIGLRI